MSSFCLRQEEPQIGDTATHTLYGIVNLVGKLKVEDNYETFWLVELIYGSNELKIVRENDLEDVGYYGD